MVVSILGFVECLILEQDELVEIKDPDHMDMGKTPRSTILPCLSQFLLNTSAQCICFETCDANMCFKLFFFNVGSLISLLPWLTTPAFFTFIDYTSTALPPETQMAFNSKKASSK